VGLRASLEDVEKKKVPDPTGTQTPAPQASSPYPVAILTALLLLLWIICKIQNKAV
jgi:hypothetical protein